jgi:DNA polymerase
MPIMKSRGRAIELDGEARGVITVHPSYLLRLPDEPARRAAFTDFVADLRFATSLIGS